MSGWGSCPWGITSSYGTCDALDTTPPDPPSPEAPTLPCPRDPLPQQFFLDMFDRLYPVDYLAPIRAGDGGELLFAYGLVGQRQSEAVVNFECGQFVLSARGGQKAEGLVVFSRAGSAAVTVQAGTVVGTSRSGRRFVTIEDAVFGIGDTAPKSVHVKSVGQGWEWNVKGQVTTAAGEVIPGEIDEIVSLHDLPAYGDPSITVKNLADTVNGRSPMLDQLGLDRGIARLSGESDADYRFRVRQLPDTVSPDAIRRVITGLFAPYGATVDFIETFQIDYQTCWDAPGTPLPNNPLYNPNLFCYDDPRPAYPPFMNRWLDECDYRGAFIVVVPNLGALEDVGMAYDDTAMTPAQHVTPGTGGLGRRAHAAYDVPSTITELVLQGGYDGFDLKKQAVYKGLYDTLQKIKAAGVTAIVELRGE